MLRFDELFSLVNPIVIGRDPDCSVSLPHPTVSAYHAVLERTGDGALVVQDLDSATGSYVNGRRVRQPTAIAEGDRFTIGPYLFTRRGAALLKLDSSRSLRLEARHLTRTVRLAGGGTRNLIDDINLVVRPGEFVTLLGPSGSGKSTLMDCLNGRRRATGGQVLANGQNFYEQFDSFRQSLGYVPQKDIVHTQLSVRRALFHTARLRLPRDTAGSELRRRVDDVIQLMELDAHQRTLVGNLSGGQIKRVSLGAELLARPSLLYIDEATSGLDAGTEARMMRLFRQLADEGRSIVCITHAIENVDQCHLVLVLSAGRMMYYGPPGEAPAYFGVRSLGQIYDRLAEQEPAEWARQFQASPLHKEFVQDRIAEGDALASQAAAQSTLAASPLPLDTISSATMEPPEPADVVGRHIHRLGARYRKARRWFRPTALAMHQFRVLTRRYLELIVRDPRSFRLLLLQAPIVALFLLVGFANKPYDDTFPYTRELSPTEESMLTQANAWRLVVAKDSTLQKAGAADRLAQLKGLRFQVNVGGAPPTELDGQSLHEKLQLLYDPQVAGPHREEIARWNIRLASGMPPSTVTGADLLQALDKSGDSTTFEALLAAARDRKPIVLERMIVDPRFTFILLNILAITVFWFGCNNAAKEIVKEQAVYARERAVNLGIMPYLASKFIVLGATSATQALALAGGVYGALWLLHTHFGQPFPPDLYQLGFVPLFGVLALLSVVGAGAGLLISACAATPDRANALLPYVLIPQIILGGAIIPIRGEPIATLATTFCPVYWAFRAIHRGASELPSYHPLYLAADYDVRFACAALGVQLLVVLAMTAGFLRLKDFVRA